MNSVYGSKWRKWDFHVHTPYSVLNNRFGLSAADDAEFDEYVKTLFTKAIEKDIFAIGITDYFSIDGYKRIRKEYLDNVDKLTDLFPDEGLRERIGQILVFPNIEFRLDRFVPKGGKDKPIGYHVLFSDEIEPEEIEENFLHKLRYAPNPDQSWTLTRRNIEQLGQQVREQNGGKGDAYELGLKNVCIDEGDVLEALRECRAFDGRSIISVPVDEALCNADWNRSYLPKKALYEQCHCYMTSNAGTRGWALCDERVAEFGSIKPCIWGSDAHSFERLFEPEGRRYCWVKADTTFEGLMQILCEPADRIAIQEERPEKHDPHRSIRSIQFHDKDFQEEPIPFNEGLTCIIGGRSTGKSLLLRNLAWSISPEYARDQENRSSVTAPVVGGAAADVQWRDGSSGERRIIYLPQTYLNRTVDDPGSGELGASKLISDVLLQNDEIKCAWEVFDAERRRVRQEFNDAVDAYSDCEAKLRAAHERLVEHGEAKLYQEGVKRLEDEYKKLLGPGGASEEEVKTYSEIKANRDRGMLAVDGLRRDIALVKSLDAPSVPEPCVNGARCFDALTDETSAALRKELDSINELVALRWRDSVNRVVASCEKCEQIKTGEIAVLSERLAVLEPKIEVNGRLCRAMSALNEERKKLIAAEKIEEEIRGLRDKMNELSSTIKATRSKLHEGYAAYGREIEPLSSSLSRGLEFVAEVMWRKYDFESFIVGALDRRMLSSFEKATGWDLQNLSDEDYCDDLLTDIWKSVRGRLEGCRLQLKGDIGQVEFCRSLFGDWYDIHYAVTSGGDRLDKMSPGKKGLVLLELIIELEQGDCPILIDQPEDDLDNQSIYIELRKFIKECKRRRQIIIVTHNANIALGADAEEIIVANQNGQGRENSEFKFEYRSGAIENNVEPDGGQDGLPFLERFSIQQHACQILDGGREALEQRRKKYSMGMRGTGR